MQSNGGVISADAGGGAADPDARVRPGRRRDRLRARSPRELGYANVICADVGGTTLRRRADRRTAGSSRRPRRRSAAVPSSGPVHRHRLDRSGRRLDRVDRRARRRQGRAAERGRASRARVLRARRHRADGHRLPPRARAARPENFLGAPDAARRRRRRARRCRAGSPARSARRSSEAADGILAIAETNMAYAIRAMTVERGLDPREFALFSYGGGGGLFAAARSRGARDPDGASSRARRRTSRPGASSRPTTARTRRDAVRPLDECSVAEAVAILRQLAERATASFERYGFDEGRASSSIYRADIRYAGQDHTITVSARARVARRRSGAARRARGERFVAAASPALRPWRHSTRRSKLVTSRCRAVGRVARPSVSEVATLEQAGRAARVRGRCIFRRGAAASRPRSTTARRARDQASKARRSSRSGRRRSSSRRAGARAPTGSANLVLENGRAMTGDRRRRRHRRDRSQRARRRPRSR